MLKLQTDRNQAKARTKEIWYPDVLIFRRALPVSTFHTSKQKNEVQPGQDNKMLGNYI